MNQPEYKTMTTPLTPEQVRKLTAHMIPVPAAPAPRPRTRPQKTLHYGSLSRQIRERTLAGETVSADSFPDHGRTVVHSMLSRMKFGGELVRVSQGQTGGKKVCATYRKAP